MMTTDTMTMAIDGVSADDLQYLLSRFEAFRLNPPASMTDNKRQIAEDFLESFGYAFLDELFGINDWDELSEDEFDDLYVVHSKVFDLLLRF